MKQDLEDVRLRSSLVNKFLDKLPNVEMKDIELLPAMEKYISGGNIDMFEEFKAFHFHKDCEKKRKDLEYEVKVLENVISTLERRKEEIIAGIKKVYKDYYKYEAEYGSYTKRLTAWHEGAMKELDTHFLKGSDSHLQWRGIRNTIDEKVRSGNQAIYVSTEKGIHPIQGLYVDDNGKIVLQIESSCIPIVQGPKEPPYRLMHGPSYMTDLIHVSVFGDYNGEIDIEVSEA